MMSRKAKIRPATKLFGKEIIYACKKMDFSIISGYFGQEWLYNIFQGYKVD